MRLKVPLLLIALLVAFGAVAAGCGGSDAPSSSSDGEGEGSGPSSAPITTSSLSKAQYLKRANAVCLKATESRRQDLTSYNDEAVDTPEPERLLGLLKQVYVPTMGAQTAALRKLGAPAGDEQQVEKMVVAFEEWVDDIRQAEGASSLPKMNRDINRAAALARKYKLIECTWG